MKITKTQRKTLESYLKQSRKLQKDVDKLEQKSYKLLKLTEDVDKDIVYDAIWNGFYTVDELINKLEQEWRHWD